MSYDPPYIWKKFANGFGSAAIVNLTTIANNLGQNEILENYSGHGFRSQGYIESVPEVGYDSWKIAAKKGLEYAFSLIETNWTVTINSIEGRAVTDTNPTIVGYTVMRAFFDKIDFHLSSDQIAVLEEFVISSWNKPYVELIPNFYNLTFSEYY